MTTRSTQIRAAILAVLIAVPSVTSTQLRADSGSCSGQTISLPFGEL